MAQVLAPIVQTSGSITMLHSSSDAFQNQPAQPHHQQQRSSQMPRGQAYNSQSGGAGYRGTSAPIAPYAFSSTPQLRQESRSSSAPNQQTPQHFGPPANPPRLGHPSHPSSSSDSTVSTSGSSSRSLVAPAFPSKDDSDLRKSAVDNFPASITLSTSVPDLSFSLSDAPVKPSPGRYRRGAGRTDSNNSGTASSSTPTPTQQSPSIGASAFSGAARHNNVPPLNVSDLPLPVRPGHHRASSVDDMQISRGGSTDPAKRYRRRSLSGLDANTMASGPALLAPVPKAPVTSTKRTTQELRPQSSSSRHGSRPSSSQSHERQGSSGSVSSNASNRPSSRQESTSLRNSAMAPATSASKAPEPARRIAPSPLSNPMSPSEPPSPAKPTAPSPAVKQLTALNDKEGGKGMKSRLRRAFSFGSAAELRRASAENNLSAERAKLRKERYQSEEDAEQAAIVAKQEAAGIGAGIYSGQGGFAGSTDNLSISSTASSASIMLRKMGSGMKKGTRSIKGLFRPKSVIGVPAADGPVTKASVGQVSMVTVEAERQKVNVNADPHDQTGGGTGFPRLERNSLDAGRSADANGAAVAAAESMPRKSIIGGDRERAEVLSSIKKGILKRSATSSDTPSHITHPTEMPNPNDSPRSSAPSTPNNDRPQPGPSHVNGDDYFARPARLANPSTRSLPNTPHGGLRNISFSPRIQFYDAWSASDYDRRGEIATCNRLTPMLAQQIKEELNSFKMEMEVHELSKPHTHFF
ncbi:hypothetical protein BU26DRAFT_441056 [Trematosphaeria pertusa]|uniref:Protein BNI4 n=1 Tax=Trematosphaeria pertusa TaxID=390896 RepID=A0A6A6HSH5_9PLEO|nr:uncharacterized protein BU26DRAFT_441056 [Trematosphaeria pertusa]KAF2241134.1 hypothetical protein BU26DRAFT_441056 [Trematosphaeria pertusa]